MRIILFLTILVSFFACSGGGIEGYVGESISITADNPEEGKDVVLYVWYDNEFGYTKQVIRLAKLIAKVRRLTYY